MPTYTAPSPATPPVQYHWAVGGGSQDQVPLPPRVTRTASSFHPGQISTQHYPASLTPANWEAWLASHIAGIAGGAMLTYYIPVGYSGRIILDYEYLIAFFVQYRDFDDVCAFADWEAASGKAGAAAEAAYHVACTEIITQAVAAVKAARPSAIVGVYNTPGNDIYVQCSGEVAHQALRAEWDALIADEWADIIACQDELYPCLYCNNSFAAADVERWAYETLSPTGRWNAVGGLGEIAKAPMFWYEDGAGAALNDSLCDVLARAAAGWADNAIMWGNIGNTAQAASASGALGGSWWPRVPSRATGRRRRMRRS